MTAHGDPNSDLTAVLNLPLIDGKMAVRGVFYNDHRGGYIDNVPATFTRRNTDVGMHYANYPSVNGQCPDGNSDGGSGFCVPPGSPAINNYNLAADAINPVTYQGLRAEALYKFNDDWDLLISQSYQHMDSTGVFYQQPNASDGAPLKPLEVTLFNASYNKDQFESTAWTVNGKFGDLKAVYTGGYLVRKVEQVSDYTNYSRGVLRGLLPVLRSGNGLRLDAHFDLLLAECHLALRRAQRAPAERIPPEHAGRLATARDCRRVSRGQQAVRPERLALQERAFLHLERRRWHAGQYRLLLEYRHPAWNDRRESRCSRRKQRLLPG